MACYTRQLHLSGFTDGVETHLIKRCATKIDRILTIWHCYIECRHENILYTHWRQCSPFSSDLAVATTLCPSEHRILQASSPIPLLPPVKSTNFFPVMSAYSTSHTLLVRMCSFLASVITSNAKVTWYQSHMIPLKECVQVWLYGMLTYMSSSVHVYSIFLYECVNSMIVFIQRTIASHWLFCSQ